MTNAFGPSLSVSVYRRLLHFLEHCYNRSEVTTGCNSSVTLRCGECPLSLCGAETQFLHLWRSRGLQPLFLYLNISAAPFVTTVKFLVLIADNTLSRESYFRFGYLNF